MFFINLFEYKIVSFGLKCSTFLFNNNVFSNNYLYFNGLLGHSCNCGPVLGPILFRVGFGLKVKKSLGLIQAQNISCVLA